MVFTSPTTIFTTAVTTNAACSPTDGTQGNCPSGQKCYTDGVCAEKCSPADGTQGNCPSDEICYTDGVCAIRCSTLGSSMEFPQGNCPSGQICDFSEGVCGNFLKYFYVALCSTLKLILFDPNIFYYFLYLFVVVFTSPTTIFTTAVTTNAACSPTDGTQGNCPSGQKCYTDGVCAEKCSPADGTQGNCPSDEICYTDGVCAIRCSTLGSSMEFPQGNCPSGQICDFSEGVCGNFLKYFYVALCSTLKRILFDQKLFFTIFCIYL